MANIQIEDLTVEQELSTSETKEVFGGFRSFSKGPAFRSLHSSRISKVGISGGGGIREGGSRFASWGSRSPQWLNGMEGLGGGAGGVAASNDSITKDSGAGGCPG